MAYREDVDLEFLGQMANSDLSDLLACVTKDKEGKALWTEKITNSELYKQNYPDHTKYWREIAAEVQCFGANTLVTLVRGGKGVVYREVLADVCDKVGVKYDSKAKTPELEEMLLIKLLGDALEKMPEADRTEFAKNVGITNMKSLTAAGLTAALQLGFKAGGFQSYQLTLIVANAVSRAILGRGLALAANATLVRTASLLTGPVGWALTGAWTMADMAGPAYRVTMPAVLQVALLRRKHSAELAGFKTKIEEELSRL